MHTERKAADRRFKISFTFTFALTGKWNGHLAFICRAVVMKNKKRHIKLPLAIFACVLMACPVSGEPDSLSLSTAAKQVAALPDDTVKVNVLDSLFATYTGDNLDVAVGFARQGLRLSEKLSFHMGRAWCLYDLGKYHYMQGRYEQAMDFWL
ncbi:MAG: tetratricopeptide repeat protein, partial [Flavobacteriales bacterium]